MKEKPILFNGKPEKDGTDISWQANPWVWVVEFKKLQGI